MARYVRCIDAGYNGYVRVGRCYEVIEAGPRHYILKTPGKVPNPHRYNSAHFKNVKIVGTVRAISSRTDITIGKDYPLLKAPTPDDPYYTIIDDAGDVMIYGSSVFESPASPVSEPSIGYDTQHTRLIEARDCLLKFDWRATNRGYDFWRDIKQALSEEVRLCLDAKTAAEKPARPTLPVNTLVRITANANCHGYKIGEVIRLSRHSSHTSTRDYNVYEGERDKWLVRDTDFDVIAIPDADGRLMVDPA